MNTRHTRDLDPNFFVNAEGELVPIPNEFAETKFDEKLHPRRSDGRFTKTPVSAEGKRLNWDDPEKRLLPLGDPGGDLTDIRNLMDARGDQAFKDVLLGLAAGAINEVHAIPKGLPRVEIEPGWFMGAGGGLDEETKRQMFIDTSHPGSSLTAIHELGHFFDYNYNKARPLNSDTKLMGAFRRSRMYKSMLAESKDPNGDDDSRDFASYSVTPREMFARAYTQYIAKRSSNRTLKDEFKERRPKERFFDDDDFVFVERELDRIFKPRKRKTKR